VKNRSEWLAVKKEPTNQQDDGRMNGVL